MSLMTIREIGLTFPFPQEKPKLDLVDEDVSAPAVFTGFSNIPFALFCVLQLIQGGDVVVPGDLYKNLLHKCGIRN